MLVSCNREFHKLGERRRGLVLMWFTVVPVINLPFVNGNVQIPFSILFMTICHS